MVNKFGKAIGIHKFDIKGESLELKYEAKDVYDFTEIINKIKQDKDNATLALKLQIEWLQGIVIRNYPHESKEEIINFVTLNFQAILQEVLIALNLSKKEDFEKKD